MSLFPSTLTGRVLDDGVTEPPVIELQGISAGQLSLAPGNQHPAHRGHRHKCRRHRSTAGPGGRPARSSGPQPLRFGQRPRRSRGPHRGQRFRPHCCQHQPDPGPGLKGQPDAGLGGPQAGEPPDDSSDELQHRFHQQRHPGHGGRNVCAEERGGPAGHRRGRSTNRGGRGPESRDCAAVLPDPDGLPGRTGPPGRPPRRA